MELQISSEIRGEHRMLVWRNGDLSGDDEFLDRVLRCAEGMHVDLSTADSLEVIRVCRDATAAPLEIVSVPNGTAPSLDLRSHGSQSRDDTFSAPA